MHRKIILMVLIGSSNGCASTGMAYETAPPDLVVIDGIPYQANEEALKKGYLPIDGKDYKLGLVYSQGHPLQVEENQAKVNGVAAGAPYLLLPTMRLLRSILWFF